MSLFRNFYLRAWCFPFAAHVMGLFCLHLAGYDFNYKQLYELAIADNKYVITNEQFCTDFLYFGAYNLSLLMVLYLLTKAIKRVILNNNWDILHHSLRTSNYWFEIFSARYLDANKEGGREGTDLIFLDVMVSDDMVYSGFLYDFEYSPSKDELETLTLKSASKRTYKKRDENKTERDSSNADDHPLKLDTARPIQGDAFVILAKDILNINIHYISLSNIEVELRQESADNSTKKPS